MTNSFPNEASINDPLFSLQLELEEKMADMGRERFYRNLASAQERKEESKTSAGKRILQGALQSVIEGVEEFASLLSSGKPGRRHVALQFINKIPSDVLAFIGLKCVIDSVTRVENIQNAAFRIADAVQDQITLDRFKAENRKLFGATMRKAQESAERRRKRLVALMMADRAGVHRERWAKRDALLFGLKIIEIIQVRTGLVEVHTTSTGRNDTPCVLRATPKTLKWIEEANTRLEVLSPTYLPTVVPPKRWTSVFDGGYWTRRVRQMPLIKTRNHNFLSDASGLLGQEVYRAINAIQETPWRVNGAVLAVAKKAWDAGIQIDGVPPVEPAPLPPKPADIAENEDARKTWRKSAAIIHNRNASFMGKRIQFRRILHIAEEFAEHGRIYFPHQMDFRGRAYAVPLFLNPQGPDIAKGLLTFADGKPIEDGTAAGWLAIHGANTYGYDKASLDERIAWTFDRNVVIQSIATDPFGEHLDFWRHADKPFQFLAFCFEWAAFLEHGYGFVSSLPVALDGTCNGLQHYSAALRDPVGGAAVNLLPSETQSDIYANVAEVALRYVNAFAATEEAGLACLPKLDALRDTWAKHGIDPVSMAHRWLAFGIDRKMTKRSVMTLPYGSSQFSCREFIEEAIREKLGSGKQNVFRTDADHDGLFQASLWLQPIVWHAIGEVVKAAREGMAWLKECARVASSEGVPITWETPDGFFVQQDYRDMSARRIRTHLDGQGYKLTVQEETDSIDSRRQWQGIAPNWVHSMDATALRMFVTLAADSGVRHFALVHDSYGSVAADMAVVSKCIRRAFIKLYTEQDPLALFKVDMAAILSEAAIPDLPPLPERGTLDLSLVGESEFFFA